MIISILNTSIASIYIASKYCSSVLIKVGHAVTILPLQIILFIRENVIIEKQGKNLIKYIELPGKNH